MVADCVNVPNHYNGFDQLAHDLLDEAVQRRKLLVISGHPAGLFRHGNEHSDAVTGFLEEAARRRDRDELVIQTVGATAAAMKEPS